MRKPGIFLRTEQELKTEREIKEIAGQLELFIKKEFEDFINKKILDEVVLEFLKNRIDLKRHVKVDIRELAEYDYFPIVYCTYNNEKMKELAKEIHATGCDLTFQNLEPYLKNMAKTLKL